MNTRITLVYLFLISLYTNINAQTDSILNKIHFESDFRFRIEQDWDSRKSNGSYRDDRTRFRYRLRAGATFKEKFYSLGFRIRTGNNKKQQDPQLTLGKGYKEFGTLPIGLEKLYVQSHYKDIRIWFGKNSYSFLKNNELFWSDNVFPEGLFIEKKFNFQKHLIDNISVKASHFVLSSNGKSILDDAYFQGFQTSIQLKNKRFTLFPSFYLFRNIPNIPDGEHTYEMDYSIFHVGAKLQPLKEVRLYIDFDYYANLEDYYQNSNISESFKDEKVGYSFGIQYGRLKEAKNWKVKLTYTALQKYAALDYMAQNDWVRWDYSAFNSPDGRLTNFQGIELVVGYSISRKMNLIAKYYNVSQIVPVGTSKETGQRIRLDLNVKI